MLVQGGGCAFAAHYPLPDHHMSPIQCAPYTIHEAPLPNAATSLIGAGRGLSWRGARQATGREGVPLSA